MSGKGSMFYHYTLDPPTLDSFSIFSTNLHNLFQSYI